MYSRTIEAEDVEQHSSDLVVGAVRVEQHRQQGPHGIFDLHPIHVCPHCKVLHSAVKEKGKTKNK